MKLKTIELKAATAPLADYACRLAEEPLVVTRDGTPVAVLLPVEGADIETVSLSLDPAFNAMLERSRASIRRHGGIPIEEMWRRLGLDEEQTASEEQPAKVGSPPKARRRNS
jgi:PHD/YefM family antitoxin component YafN of YafNO toxin-antitoxin module